MCKCTDCGNCTRDKTEDKQTNTIVEENTNDAIEISCLKLPEVLYDAICVLNGRYGTGAERKQLLGSKYEKVQSAVNLIADLYN